MVHVQAGRSFRAGRRREQIAGTDQFLYDVRSAPKYAATGSDMKNRQQSASYYSANASVYSSSDAAPSLLTFVPF